MSPDKCYLCPPAKHTYPPYGLFKARVASSCVGWVSIAPFTTRRQRPTRVWTTTMLFAVRLRPDFSYVDRVGLVHSAFSARLAQVDGGAWWMALRFV